MDNEIFSQTAAAQTAHEPHFLVVGLGAAAGGGAALERLFACEPADSGMAFVVIPHLLPNHESNLHRIAQESLSNISKHAGASRVEILLEQRHDFAVPIIEDDGRGFEPEKAIVTSDSPRGLGLVGMRERAALVSGSLEIESAPGATVYARIPVKDGAAEKTDG